METFLIAIALHYYSLIVFVKGKKDSEGRGFSLRVLVRDSHGI